MSKRATGLILGCGLVVVLIALVLIKPESPPAVGVASTAKCSTEAEAFSRWRAIAHADAGYDSNGDELNQRQVLARLFVACNSLDGLTVEGLRKTLGPSSARDVDALGSILLGQVDRSRATAVGLHNYKREDLIVELEKGRVVGAHLAYSDSDD